MATALGLLALWALATAMLLAHALIGIPGDYLGEGYPMFPSLTVSHLSLLRDSALATSPIPVATLLMLWPSRRFHLARFMLLSLVALLWLSAADQLIWLFVIDFGTTWAGFEPLLELILHPVLTPLALALMLALAWRVSAPHCGAL
jgi:hypothetical protein